jgi:hypothetical protein
VRLDLAIDGSSLFTDQGVSIDKELPEMRSRDELWAPRAAACLAGTESMGVQNPARLIASALPENGVADDAAPFEAFAIRIPRNTSTPTTLVAGNSS